MHREATFTSHLRRKNGAPTLSYDLVHRGSSVIFVVLIVLLGLAAFLLSVQMEHNRFLQREQAYIASITGALQTIQLESGRLVESIHTNQQLFDSFEIITTRGPEAYMRFRLDNYTLSGGVPSLLEWYGDFNADWSLVSVAYLRWGGLNTLEINRNATLVKPMSPRAWQPVGGGYLNTVISEEEGRLIARVTSRITDPITLDPVADVVMRWDKNVSLRSTEEGVTRHLYVGETVVGRASTPSSRSWLDVRFALDDHWGIRTAVSYRYLLRRLTQQQAVLFGVVVLADRVGGRCHTAGNGWIRRGHPPNSPWILPY